MYPSGNIPALLVQKKQALHMGCLKYFLGWAAAGLKAYCAAAVRKRCLPGNIKMLAFVAVDFFRLLGFRHLAVKYARSVPGSESAHGWSRECQPVQDEWVFWKRICGPRVPSVAPAP